MVKEALVVCGDKGIGAGLTIWDMDTGDHLLHIPTCSSPSHGLLCLRNEFLVASQIHKHGSFGGGAIFFWPLNKPQAPLRSYPIEAIGPVSCTKDGLYLVGGAPSGNAYVWEISSGRLLKRWHAHHIPLNCIVFSDDNSLLVCGSDDGVILIWSMISLLDMADCRSFPSLLYSLSGHQSSVTGLLSTGSSSSVLVSSSLDGTCKVWNLLSGSLLQTHAFPQAITAIVLDLGEQLLFSGAADGSIFVSALDIGLREDPSAVLDDHLMMLTEHRGSITALAFSISGLCLISASDDCTVCLWDVSCWTVTRRFNHQKGQITNLVVIPQSSLLSMANQQRVSHHFHVSLLDKYPQPMDTSWGTVTPLPSYCLSEDHHITGFLSTDLLTQQILDLERDQTPEAIQMKVQMSIENRMWATNMTKHVTEMNKHLRTRLLDLMQCRLLLSPNLNLALGRKRKKIKITSPPPQEKENPDTAA